MKNIHLKFEDKILKVELPESWQEVNCEIMARLKIDWDQKSTIGLFCALTGLDEFVLNNVETKTGKLLYEQCRWMGETPPDFKKLKRPKVFHFLGKDIEIPKSLEMERLGQYEQASQLIAAHAKEIPILIPKLCAIYIQKAYEGVCRPERIEYFEEQINKTPAIEIYPIYYFFLTRLTKFRLGGLLSLLLSLLLRSRPKVATTSLQQGVRN